MPSPVIQARLAPVALLVALAFVVVGFLRVDREMTQAERDRATLTASETATLVEVFLLRQVTRLQSIERVAEVGMQDSLVVSQLRDTSEALANFGSDQFDQLWAIVPNSRGYTIAKLGKGTSQLDRRLEHHCATGETPRCVRTEGGCNASEWTHDTMAC